MNQKQESAGTAVLKLRVAASVSSSNVNHGWVRAAGGSQALAEVTGRTQESPEHREGETRSETMSGELQPQRGRNPGLISLSRVGSFRKGSKSPLISDKDRGVE